MKVKLSNYLKGKVLIGDIKMKLTKATLKKIIKEELNALMREEDGDISIPELDEDFFNAGKSDMGELKYIGSWMGGETSADNLDLYQSPAGSFVMVTVDGKTEVSSPQEVLAYLESRPDDSAWG